MAEAIQCSTRKYQGFFGKARKCEIETHAKWLTTGQKLLLIINEIARAIILTFRIHTIFYT